MIALFALFEAPWAHRLGWVLLHFLWQGAVVAGGVAVILPFLNSARLRYAALCLAFVVCGTAPVVTWEVLAQGGAEMPPAAAHLGGNSVTTVSVGGPSVAKPSLEGMPVTSTIKVDWRDRGIRALGVFLPYVVVLWLSGLLILSLRLLFGWLHLQRLCRSGAALPEIDWLGRFHRLVEQMQVGRTVRLLETAMVEVPTLVGWLHPTIFLPASLLTGLTAGQLEAILAHELAHVRRHDYLVNLVQTVIETILFYHPAIWWISRRIREERENCCDDLALEVLRDRVVYASALAALEEWRTCSSPFALAASGGSLLRRIRRIAHVERRTSSPVPLLVTALLVGGLVALLTGQVVAASQAKDSPSINNASLAAPGGNTQMGNSSLNKALINAAGRGDLAKVESLLKQGADPNANEEPDGLNALFEAAQSNHLEVTKLLLQNGADPNGKNDCGNLPITWVLNQGHLEVATALHSAGAKISPEGWAGANGDLVALKSLVESGSLKKGQTDKAMKCAVSMGQMEVVHFLEGIEGKPVASKFLVQAAESGNLSMMEYILGRGADLKKEEGDALDMAVMFYNQPEAVKCLLAHGADPNRYTGWQQYILAGATSSAVVKILLEGGADPNSEDMFGTALSQAPDVESVRLLVAHGANLKPKLKNGNTLIESNIIRNLHDNAEIVEELIKQGAEFDPKGNGERALVRAVAAGYVRIAGLLMDRGVSPNSYSDHEQISPLGSAARTPGSDTLKLLLARGANPDGDPRESYSPSYNALVSGQFENARILRAAGAVGTGDLSYYSLMGDAAKVNELIKDGADLNETDRSGQTPLNYAIRRGQIETARLLLEHGANVNLFSADGLNPYLLYMLFESRRPLDPLMSQALWGVSPEEFQRRADGFKELFVKYPPDFNFQDRRGWSILHQAAWMGNTLISFLTGDKAHPVDPNLRNHEGQTALLLAALSPRAHETETRLSTLEDVKKPQGKRKDWNEAAFTADQLIKAGAKLDLVVKEGRTVGDLAQEAATKAKNEQLLSVLQEGSAIGTRINENRDLKAKP